MMENNCYMTLVTDQKYIPCVKRCNFLMKHYENQYPYIALVPKNNLDIQYELENANVKFIPIQIDKFSSPQYGVEIHADTINKFQIFNFTEYDKICFIDADMVICKNTDYLFDDLTDDQQTHFYFSERPGLNGEFFIVRPNSKFYAQIYAEKDQYVNDEEVLNKYFSEQFKQHPAPQGPLIHFAGPLKIWERSNTTFPELQRLFFEKYTSNEQFAHFVENFDEWHGQISTWRENLSRMLRLKLYAVLINTETDFEKALKLEKIMKNEYGIQFPFMFIMNYKDGKTMSYLDRKSYVFIKKDLSHPTFLESLIAVHDAIQPCTKFCFIYNLDMEMTESLDYLFSDHLSPEKRQQTMEKYQNDIFFYAQHWNESQ